MFNQSGQTIDLSGLLCAFDADGPFANSVKDSQRAKTDESTTRTLTLIWGTNGLEGRTAAVLACHLELNARLGATVRAVQPG